MFIVGSQACQNSWKCVKNGKLGLMGVKFCINSSFKCPETNDLCKYVNTLSKVSTSLRPAQHLLS